MAATQERLDKIAREVARRTKKPLLKEEIALKVGKVIGRFKMAKHFELSIDDGRFEYRRDETSVGLAEIHADHNSFTTNHIPPMHAGNFSLREEVRFADHARRVTACAGPFGTCPCLKPGSGKGSAGIC